MTIVFLFSFFLGGWVFWQEEGETDEMRGGKKKASRLKADIRENVQVWMKCRFLKKLWNQLFAPHTRNYKRTHKHTCVEAWFWTLEDVICHISKVEEDARSRSPFSRWFSLFTVQLGIILYQPVTILEAAGTLCVSASRDKKTQLGRKVCLWVADSKLIFTKHKNYKSTDVYLCQHN